MRETLITPEGQPTDDPDKAIPADAEERLRLARRLVADRCLYGVDKNPLAVEMAKLSLWLVALDKNRPFTFLDHALKHGDSLVGADEQMFLRWSESLKGTVGPLYYEENEKDMALARQKRRALQAFTVRDVRDAEEKARLLAEAETVLARVKRGCDLLVGVRLLGLNQSEQETWLAELLIEHTAREELTSQKAQQTLAAARQVDAFHWPFEFPEVFAQGGFSAFVGNPPFIGEQRIRATMGGGYLQYLKDRWNHTKRSSDYSAYFFLNAFAHLQMKGNLGLIATNTIAQGATLELGLDHIHKQSGSVYHAYNDYLWPGQAAVVVDIVHIHKGKYSGQKILNGVSVSNITPMLDVMPVYDKPYQLIANANKSFQGSNVLGLGFTMPPEEAHEHIMRNPRNKEVLFPYLNGQDLNSSPTQEPSRWVINFFDWPLECSANGSWHNGDEKQQKQWLQNGRVPTNYPNPVAADYPEMLEIVIEKVYPEGAQNQNKQRREIWWRFTRPTIELWNLLTPFKRTIAVSQTSKYHSFVLVPTSIVYSHKLIIFTMDKYSQFAQLQSTIHTDWVLKRGSTLETRPVYTPTDCFETFPFPGLTNKLDHIGGQYYEHRHQLMLNRQEGLTETYNRFHTPAETSADIARLRELHVEMDNVVAAAYGSWSWAWFPPNPPGPALHPQRTRPPRGTHPPAPPQPPAPRRRTPPGPPRHRQK